MQYGVPVFEFVLMAAVVVALSAHKAAAQEDSREETHQTFQLSSFPRVAVLNINSRVTIESSDSDTAEVEIVRVARQQNDLKYHPVMIEHTADSLKIQGQENRAAYGRGIQVEQQLKLKIPRHVQLEIEGVGGAVHIGQIDGPLKVRRVSGALTIEQVAGSLDVSNVGSDLRATMGHLDQNGIHINQVGGEVDLRFAGEVNAELSAKSIGGSFYVNLPNANMSAAESAVSLSARIGMGGAPISLVKIGGTVRLAHGS